MGKRLAVGVVGLGRIGACHAQTLVWLDDVSVTVTDTDSERTRRLAEQLGVDTA